MLFGRADERAHLEQLLDGAESGPVACILEGVPGIGKTTLWREAVEGARRRGHQVLESAPSEPESVLSFSGLGDLFERLPGQLLDALPDVQAHALRSAVFLDEPSGSAGDQRALPRAVLEVLRQLSAAGPVVVAIDDEQWLDPASARVLAFALCRLRDEPIGVIVARRSNTDGTLSAELGRRFGGRGVESISLEPLPMRTTKVLLEARLERSISAPLLRRIHQGAEGNPLWALAIALEAEARNGSEGGLGDLPIPRTLSDAIELRLEHIDPQASAAMLAIAALSQPTLSMLQAAIPKFALSDLESAERAGVIESSGGRLRFTHPLLASTHYRNTPVSKRRELHRLLATVIDDEEERARHVALGAEAPDRELADSLERAAGVAARRGANESAAQLLEDAARLTPIDQEHSRMERIVTAAEHRFTRGEASRVRYMLEDVMPDLGPGPLRARARLLLAEISAHEPHVAMELLLAAREDAGADEPSRVHIEWELSVATVAIGRLEAARAHAKSAVRAAERLEDPALLARALGELLITLVTTGESLPQDLIARLSAMEDSPALTTYYQPTTAIGAALYWAGECEAARPALQRAAQLTLSRDEEWDRMAVMLMLSPLEWEIGNQDLAKQHREAAGEAMGELDEGHLLLAGLDARYALEEGNITAARELLDRGLGLAERVGANWHATRFTRLLAAVDLMSDQPEAAHARLKAQREWLKSVGFGPGGQIAIPMWSLDVEALIALGRLEEAEDVLTELRARAEACSSDSMQAIALRCEGLLSAASGDPDAAIAAMDRAVAAHLRQPRPYEHGRTLLEKGSIERRARRKAAAKQTLEQALSILEPLRAQILVSRTRDELSRIGIRRAKATDGLTPAQARVAELATAGSTNAEIARQLHMSLRTVEAHLSRVYREHGVTSRAQLAAALARR
jgi:DNA-binding NarL/FixJ family response regulator